MKKWITPDEIDELAIRIYAQTRGLTVRELGPQHIPAITKLAEQMHRELRGRSVSDDR